MKEFRYEIEFLTPAFLGDACQEGHWRVPPFKALLRQWWRVAAARRHDYDWKRVRVEEGKVFGHAYGDKDAQASRVRLRLDPGWKEGRTDELDWSKNQFGSVVTTKSGKGKVSSELYTGFGPVTPGPRSKRPTARRAIDRSEKATLRLLYSGTDEVTSAQIGDTLQLAHWFGAMGSRSRNGWGSLALNGGAALSDHRAMAGSELLGASHGLWSSAFASIGRTL